MSVKPIVQVAKSSQFGTVGRYLASTAILVDEKTLEEARSVSVDLLDTMEAQPLCVGLAANQIDSPLSVAVVSRSGTQEEPLILFNPIVLSRSGKKDKKRESCMSVWGFAGEVERRSNIVIAFVDDQLQPTELALSGFVARVAEHEIDHLQGVTFVDHVAGALTPTDLFDGFSPGVP